MFVAFEVPYGATQHLSWGYTRAHRQLKEMASLQINTVTKDKTCYKGAARSCKTNNAQIFIWALTNQNNVPINLNYRNVLR